MQGTERLLELQEIDTAAGRLRARRDVLTSGAEADAARHRADGAENSLGELGLKLDAIGREQLRVEHEVDSLAQKSAAEERRLYDGSIVNTKELESLQREIENLKLLGMMEEREQLEAAAAEARVESDRLRTSSDAAAVSARDELANIETELAALTSKREDIVPAIDAELVELYDDLRAQKKGIGVAELVDGVCQGCHEKLSAMEMDRIKHADGIRRCEHCRRIVVLR